MATTMFLNIASLAIDVALRWRRLCCLRQAVVDFVLLREV